MPRSLGLLEIEISYENFHGLWRISSGVLLQGCDRQQADWWVGFPQLQELITVPPACWALLLFRTFTKPQKWAKSELGWRNTSFFRSDPPKYFGEHLPFLPSSRRPITPTSLSTPGCPFFQLPAEIRNMILTMAFGGRALHMDIVRSHEGWVWRGAICHLKLPGALSSTRYYWESDICPNDRWNACGCKETPPEEYKVGIMGFLLSCKQAYTQGIDILYSTNIITIQTTVLLFYLPISSYPADSPVSHPWK